MKDKIISEIEALQTLGTHILVHVYSGKEKITTPQMKDWELKEEYENYKKTYTTLNTSYQNWYSRCTSVIKQIMPDRYNEFISYYIIEKRKEVNALTYTISDYLLGVSLKQYGKEVLNPFGVFTAKFESQRCILASAIFKINSVLYDIENVLQTNLFENEIEAAKELLKKKHIRPAGVLVGVVLESHLSKVCKNHYISMRRRNPTISDFNEYLKKEEILDIPTWRLIQRLGDIRNLSAHPKEREPKVDEIEDLIRGTEKIIAEVF